MKQDMRMLEDAVKGFVEEDVTKALGESADVVEKGKACAEKFLVIKHLMKILEDGYDAMNGPVTNFVGEHGDLTSTGERFMTFGRFKLTRYFKENKKFRPGAEDTLREEDTDLLRKCQTTKLDDKKVLALHKDGQIKKELLDKLLSIEKSYYVKEGSNAE